MTKDIVEKVNIKIDDILEKGGVEKLIQDGTIQTEIAESSIKFQNDVEDKKAIVIGVNKLINKESFQEKNIIELSEEDRDLIIAEFKSSRSESAANKALLLLEEKAKTSENLIPYIIECSDSKCTLGEISHSLKKVFGEYSL
jgi:methylmalonyl-CoA mutase N-terminal domain/subunit